MNNYDIDLIKALKQNKYTIFRGWSPEMQTLANEIGRSWFDHWTGTIWLELQEDLCFENHAAYRLRPGYEEKPGFIECKVYENMHGDLCYKREGEKERVFTDAFIDTAFDGFIYKDTYQYERYMEPWLNLDKKMDGNYEVTHATHVLFQESK
jgi:hypothetical protein